MLGRHPGASAHTADRKVLEKAGELLAVARASGLRVLDLGVMFDADYLNRTSRSARFTVMETDKVLRR